MNILESPRLLLIPLEDQHLPGLHAINGDASVMALIGDGLPLSRQQSQLMIDTVRRHWSARGMSWWALLRKDSGLMVGAAALQPLQSPGCSSPEIAWRLRRDCWGMGYATEAAGTIIEHARAAGEQRLVAVAYHTNLASIKVMRRLGMQYHGLETHHGQPCTVFELAL